MKKPTVLMILDGFGFAEPCAGNAISLAEKPYLDQLFKNYPHATLGASGMDVGLPTGQMGNSEVGHLNIGAGRIVYQELTRISKDIETLNFFKNTALLDAVAHAKKNNSALHLLGLLSDGGVHSHLSHLTALLELAKKEGLQKVYVHAFLDGRDVPPRSAIKYISELEETMQKLGTGRIATISGRYYAMDRDNRWERVAKAYAALSEGSGMTALSAEDAVEKAYARDENDEFVQPTVVLTDNQPTGILSAHDSAIMFNFRPDRAREITRTFTDPDFTGFERDLIPDMKYICLTQYDATMPNVSVAYPPQTLDNTLGEYLSAQGLKQLRIAETEKYAHVTFFFNGGVEKPNPDENRVLIPSPKVATYDLQPEMSAYEVTEKLLEEIQKDLYDVIILNFANPDMVGHTGIIPATIKAIETVDACVQKVVDAVLEKDGQLLITADHGNADCMLDETGHTMTAHSLNPVPLLLVGNALPFNLSDGILADIAPTLLELIGLPAPKEMTGKSLLIK